MYINCVAYEGGKKLADIQPSEIHSYVCQPECFVWVALFEPTREELGAMHKEFDLPDLALEDALNGHQRPKIEEYGDTLFAVLHIVEMVEDELNVGEVDVFVGRNYILSVRSRTQKGFLGVRARSEREPELLRHGAGYVLYAITDAVVDRYFPVLDALEVELEEIERRIFSGQNNRAIIESLYGLKQKLRTLKHATSPLLEAIGKLYGGRVPYQCSRLQDYFRDIYDHLTRIHASIEGIREMLTTAIQVNLGMISLSENEVTKKLAAWAAIIAVPTMVAGIYGMNFKHMPELDWQYGYFVSIAMMALVDVYLYFRFKKAHWL
jgi:magnesium transporter